MITRRQISEVLFKTIHKGATDLAPDVRKAFADAIERETDAAARSGLSRTYDSICAA